MARGATPHVLCAAGLDHATQEHRPPETAACAICGGGLQFGTGEYGQTIERCTTTRCPLRRWHRPIPDARLAEGPTAEERRAAHRREYQRVTKSRQRRTDGRPERTGESDPELMGGNQ